MGIRKFLKNRDLLQLLENKYVQGHCNVLVDILLVENAKFITFSVNYSLW